MTQFVRTIIGRGGVKYSAEGAGIAPDILLVEILLFVGPACAARQFKFGSDVEDQLAERRIGGSVLNRQRFESGIPVGSRIIVAQAQHGIGISDQIRVLEIAANDEIERTIQLAA